MSNQKISTKKLKAIVFTDIVDFTKISAEDEQRALEIIQKQREILKPIVLNNKGEWLKEIGDGLLFSFDSSLDAVQCSIKIQEALRDVDDFKLRIGIHQGDIFITDGDVYGDDVNIASRVEGFSPEGGISISDKVYKDIQGVKEIKTSFIGHKPLKGVNQETKVRCITSNDLPNIKVSIFPKLAYYWSFVLGLLLLFFIVPVFIHHCTIEDAWDIEFPIKNIDFVIQILTQGIIFILLGYTCLSYVKGVSQKAQKFTVYFTYFYAFYFLLDEFIIPYISEPINFIWMDMTLLVCMFIVSILLAINKFKKR